MLSSKSSKAATLTVFLLFKLSSMLKTNSFENSFFSSSSPLSISSSTSLLSTATILSSSLTISTFTSSSLTSQSVLIPHQLLSKIPQEPLLSVFATSQ